MTDSWNALKSDYLAHLKSRGKSTKHATYGLKIYFRYLEENDLDPLAIQIKHAQDYQIWLMTRQSEEGQPYYAKNSVLDLMGSVTGFYTYLDHKHLIHGNPFMEIDRIQSDRFLPKDIPKEEEMERFLEHLADFDTPRTLREKKTLYKAHLLAEFMYATGARIGEAAKVKEEDIDFDTQVVILKDAKTKQEREAFLNDYVTSLLKIYLSEMRNLLLERGHRSPSPYLFGAPHYLKPWFNAVLTKEARKLQMGTFTSHRFRHAVGVHLLRGGCDIRFIQDILGHRSLSSTQIYTQVEKGDLKTVLDRYHPRIWRVKTKQESS